MGTHRKLRSQVCGKHRAGTARDILTEAIGVFPTLVLKIVMHCHDEVVCEVPLGKSSIDEVCRIMAG